MKETIKIENINLLREIFGIMDSNVKLLEETFDVIISVNEDTIVIDGDKESSLRVKKIVKKLISELDIHEPTKERIEYLVHLDNNDSLPDKEDNSYVIMLNNGKKIYAKTFGQKKYIESIFENVVTFGVGPAGTGKTYLATACAARAYKNKEVERIIVARPAIEAGEKLGFLPGDMQEKVDPYLRPVFDGFLAMFGYDKFEKLRDRGIIEVVPLAYMRGRTLDNSFIILDEAQNTTIDQMKMFLTRFGTNSKVVVNGDITQIDLPRGVKSGLNHAVKLLVNIKGIAFNYFTKDDVMRHSLVKKILSRYEEEKS